MTLDVTARGAVQALAAYAMVSSLVALVVARAWPRVARRRGDVTSRADGLFALRLLPTLAGGSAAAAALLAFVAWEPHLDDERVGLTAVATALFGAALIGSGVGRAARVLARTRQAERRLRASVRASLLHQPLPGLLVDAAFPVVAVIGLVRARLVVARSVVDACTTDEFRAIVAHETAHARAHDNLRRLAVIAAPDLLAWMQADAGRLRDWSAAAEEAADDAAAAGDDGLHLASALIKVARLAVAPGLPSPASTLYDGASIANRVARLLSPSQPGGPRRPSALVRCTLAAAAAAPLSARAVHAAAEAWLALP